jgi:hypothetical protein
MMDVPEATDGHVREELGLYVLGALNDEETAVVEAHLAWCDDCWADYDYISAVPAVLATLTDADVRGLLEAEGSPEPARATGHIRHGYSISHRRSGRGQSRRPMRDRPDPSPAGAGDRASRAVPAQVGPGRRSRSSSRRGKLLVVAAAVALAAGAGLGLALRSPGPVDQAPAHFAASASDSGKGVSASVAVTGHDDSSDIVLTVRGLALGARYYLSLVTRDGRTVVVGEWLAEGTEHTVAGTVTVSAGDISFFAVTGEDRSVILSVPLRRTSNAPGE